MRRGEEAVAAFTSSPSIDGGGASDGSGGDSGASLGTEDSGAAASTLAEAGIAVSTARHDSSLLLLARRTVSNFKP